MGPIAKNIVALLGSQVASWLVTILLLIFIPQYLGDKQFGQFSFAVSFVGFFGMFAGLAGGTFVVKQIARDHRLVGPYVLNALLMGLPLAGLLSGAAIAGAYLLGYPAQTSAIVAVGCIGMTLNTVNSTLVSGLQGQQRMGRTALWAIVDRYIVGALLIAVLLAGKGLFWVAVAASLSGIVSIAGNGTQLARQLRASGRLDFRLWKVLAWGGAPFLLWSIVLTVYGSIDIIMLSKMTSDAVVGWYSLAFRLVATPVFLASIVVTALFPQLSAFGASASSEYTALVNRAVRMVFFASAPMTAGLALVAGDLLAFLHYPTQFTHSVPLIRILALHIPIVGITMVLGAALMAGDRQKQWVGVGVIAAVCNPLLNLFAIPFTVNTFGNGAVGSSVITVATELVMLCGALYLMRRYNVPNRQTIGFVVRCSVACAAMVGIVVVSGGTWLPVRIIIGMITYGLASLALGTLSASEVGRGFFRILGVARLSRAPSIS
ncbi:MAG: Polysaccharide biosynthesis protein [Chloroflexi bacterium]|jgi:O-antigen/teichoic acid export membrane protein|nr:Polysaccharide biosynthesis protein [Chloroflexota bacterium]